jgi:Putative restriction endonuclease
MAQAHPMLQTPTQRPSPLTIPPLENGDRLTRLEFERRYAAMDPNCQAELIEGIVYMASALRVKSHGQPHSLLNVWLTTYRISTPGLIIADAPTVLLDPDNEPQPDLALLIDPAHGGQTRLTADDYIEGAPELLAEIAASTVSIDLGAKKLAYERNGVREYLVWRVLDREIDWFVWQEGKYVDLLPDPDRITRSQVFPGLWLDRSALIHDDMARVMAVLQTGLASSEHADFAAGLEPG